MRQRKNGFTLVEVMIVTGLMGLSMMGVADIVASLNRQQKLAEIKLALQSQSIYYFEKMRDGSAHQQTINSNQSLINYLDGSVPELSMGSFEDPNTVRDLALYGVNGELIIPAEGLWLTSSGGLCHSQGRSASSCDPEKSYLRAKVQWIALLNNRYELRLSLEVAKEKKPQWLPAVAPVIQKLSKSGQSGDGILFAEEDTVDNLVPGDLYMVSVSGTTRTQIVSTQLYPTEVTDCEGEVLSSSFTGHRDVRLSVGTAPISDTLYVRAPEVGRICLQTDCDSSRGSVRCGQVNSVSAINLSQLAGSGIQ